MKEDTISRHAVIDALDRFSLGETDAVKLAFRMGDYLKRLPSAEPEQTCEYWDSESKFCTLYRPSAQPERKKAYLINPNPYGQCSDCGYLIDIREKYNYCPNCGAKMKDDLISRQTERKRGKTLVEETARIKREILATFSKQLPTAARGD